MIASVMTFMRPFKARHASSSGIVLWVVTLCQEVSVWLCLCMFHDCSVDSWTPHLMTTLFSMLLHLCMYYVKNSTTYCDFAALAQARPNFMLSGLGSSFSITFDSKYDCQQLFYQYFHVRVQERRSVWTFSKQDYLCLAYQRHSSEWLIRWFIVGMLCSIEQWWRWYQSPCTLVSTT